MIRALIFFLTVFSLLMHGCASPPRKELEAARTAVAKAYSNGAAELAPAKYQTAVEVLNNGEELVTRRQYRLARETLPYAEALAQQATHAAREEQIRREREKALREERLALLKQQLAQEAEAITQQKKQRPAKAEPPSEPKLVVRPRPPKPKPQSPAPAPVTKYTVNDGETLWLIASRKQVYHDAFLWPLLYRANRDQIRDPRRIYTGQVLNIPRNLGEAELKEARATARKSDIFPLPLLQNVTPDDSR